MIEYLKQHRFWIKSFCYVWGILVLTFSFCNLSFFLGNHDYLYLRFGMEINSGVWEGRLTQFIFPWLLSLNQILPIINMLMGLLFYAMAAVLLAKWYGLETRYRVVVPFALLIMLNPYIVSQIYYTYTILSIGIWHFCSVLGTVLIFSGVGRRRWALIVTGMACLFLCMSGYAPSLQLVMTILVGKFILDVIQKDAQIKKLFVQYVVSFLFIMIVSLALFALISYLKKLEIVYEMYNVKVLTVQEIFYRLTHNWAEPWKVLFEPMPYCPFFYQIFLGVLILLSFISVSCWKKGWFILGMVALGYALCASAWLAPKYIFHYYRINSFSFPYTMGILYALIWLNGKQWTKNVVWAMGMIMLFLFIRADIIAQKIWHLGNQQDTRIVERIKKDVLPELVKGRVYRMSTVGELHGQAKFAQKVFMPERFDHIREYYYYPFYLPIFFSHSFFSTEAFNPVWGDANYFDIVIMMFINNNEYITKEEQKKSLNFLYARPIDRMQVWNALAAMQTFPKEKYYYIGSKDIILRLGDDMPRKYLLLQDIQKWW